MAGVADAVVSLHEEGLFSESSSSLSVEVRMRPDPAPGDVAAATDHAYRGLATSPFSGLDTTVYVSITSGPPDARLGQVPHTHRFDATTGIDPAFVQQRAHAWAELVRVRTYAGIGLELTSNATNQHITVYDGSPSTVGGVLADRKGLDLLAGSTGWRTVFVGPDPSDPAHHRSVPPSDIYSTDAGPVPGSALAAMDAVREANRRERRGWDVITMATWATTVSTAGPAGRGCLTVEFHKDVFKDLPSVLPTEYDELPPELKPALGSPEPGPDPATVRRLAGAYVAALDRTGVPYLVRDSSTGHVEAARARERCPV